MNYPTPDIYDATEGRRNNLVRGRVYTIDFMFRQPVPNDEFPLLLVRARSHIYGDVVWVYLPRMYCLYFDDRVVHMINSGRVLYGIICDGWTNWGSLF